jgi:DNA-directed RNA polymerase specialized sigma24 family protein
MQSQSATANAKHSVDIEHLIDTELKDTVAYFIGKYGKTCENKLGLTRDDLLNDIREQVWKGLLTHDKDKRANLKTYLNRLIKNRFGVLLTRSTIPKYSNVDYFADVYTSTGIDEEHLITEDTGETVFERRQIIMQDMATLGPQDRWIYGDLLLGRSLDEMVNAHKLPRVKVIASINRIDDMIKRRARRGL